MRRRRLLLALACLAGCQVDDRTASLARDDQAHPATWGVGTAVAPADLAPFDTDVSPTGAGLPPGSGDATLGASLYRTRCAVCHGGEGEGIAPNPPLVGREPRDGFPFGRDPALVRTIGNYWPYATTLFDYIRRTMPLDAPGSLRDDEVYSLTAWLLAENEVIPAGSRLDSASLAAVRMPARDRFVPDDRTGGKGVR
jgi:cytochrome c